jgi:hypothetical protein
LTPRHGVPHRGGKAQGGTRVAAGRREKSSPWNLDVAAEQAAIDASEAEPRRIDAATNT